MNRRADTALRVAGIALALSALGALTGCGGSDSDGSADASKGLSTEELCAKMTDITTTLSQGDPKDSAATVKAVHGWVGDIEDSEPPSELTGEARDGYEMLVATLKKVKDDATADDLQNMLADVPAADVKKMQEFSVWTSENCGSSGGGS